MSAARMMSVPTAMSSAGVRRLATACGLGCALLLAACDSPTVPPRLIAYKFSYEGFNEPVIYRWAVGQRIGVHVLPSGDPHRDALLNDAFRHTADAWNDAVLYGEYRLETAELRDADVLLAWANQTLPLDTSECTPLPGGSAWLTFCADSTLTEVLAYPLTSGEHSGEGVYMIVQVLHNPAAEELVPAFVAHEFGHVLGIGTHPCRLEEAGCTRREGAHESLMYVGVPERATPSAADRATIEMLYQTRPHLTP